MAVSRTGHYELISRVQASLAETASLRVELRLLSAELMRTRAELNSARDALQIQRTLNAVAAGTGNPEEARRQILDALVPRLADWCAIDWLLPRGRVDRAVLHRDPARAEAARRLKEQAGDARDPLWRAALAARNGAERLYADLAATRFAPGVSAEGLHLLGQLGIRSIAILPLRAGGEGWGALTLGSGEGRALSPTLLSEVREYAVGIGFALAPGKGGRAAGPLRLTEP